MRNRNILLVAVLLILSACSGQQDELVVYAGRSEALVEPIVEQFREQTDVPVQIRYGQDAELLAALQEEGSQTSADVLWANTVGALSAARNAELLQELPDSILTRPGAYTPSSGLWVPVTSRFRVLAYNTSAVDSSDLPDSVLDLPEMNQFEGRIGWTPTYSSFQDFVTAMRIVHGPDTTRTWLQDMQELNPEAYTSNTPMIQALSNGEIDVALTNHYYVLRLKYGGGEGEYEEEEEEEEEAGEEEEGGAQPDAPVGTYHFESGDVGNLALVTGAAQLSTSDQPEAALEFIRFLHSETAQRYAATEVNEYPVVDAVELPDYMLPADRALRLSPQFDFERLRNLDETLTMLREVGLI